jgi:hypothetical protein
VRWLGYELEPPQAGALTRARVALENAGTAPWRGLNLSYHWLDDRGNPILWDGLRYEVGAAPRERIERDFELRGPIPPGQYRLAFDLVDEQRFWLAELGNYSPHLDVEVAPRNASAARAHLPRTPTSTPTGRNGSTQRTWRDTQRSAGRSSRDGRPQSSSRMRPGEDAILRSRIRWSCRPCSLHSSRTPRSQACRRGSRKATSPGSTTPGSDFDCDLVVDAVEDERA